jgi:hypothetical protein
MKKLAPGLHYYPALETDIQHCQEIGKQVLISIGGPHADMPLDSDEQAIDFADKLWELFGPVTDAIDPSLRPFGSAVVDGFDLSMSLYRPSVLHSLTPTRQTRRMRLQLRHPGYHAALALCRRPQQDVPPDGGARLLVPGHVDPSGLSCAGRLRVAAVL